MKRTESEILTLLKGFHRSAEQPRSEFLERARENYRFYVGGDQQWDPADIGTLDEEGRPHLTFNKILSTINLISGYQSLTRESPKFFPRRGGTASAAGLYTAMANHAREMCDGSFQESLCFFDGAVGGKGYMVPDIDKSEDPDRGDLVYERKSPFRICEDPDCEQYDITKHGKWYYEEWKWTQSEIDLAYPEAGDELTGGLEFDQTDSFFSDQNDTDDDAYKDDRANPFTDQTEKPADQKLYKVRCFYWREQEKASRLIDRETLDVYEVEGKSLDVARVLQTQNPQRWKVVDDVVTVLYKAVQVGQLVVEYVKNPYKGYRELPLFRFCPYWVDGYTFGVVDNLKDPQREINKRISQALHNLNKSANSGFYNPATGGADSKDLEANGSRPGAVIEYQKTPPTPMTPQPLSHGHIELAAISNDAIPQISGVNEQLLGQVEGRESGIAIQLRQRQGLVVSEALFRNWRMTKSALYRGMLGLIREMDVYSDAEIAAIVDKEQLLDRGYIEKASQMAPGPQVPDIEKLSSLPPMIQRRVMQQVQAAVMQYRQQLPQLAIALMIKDLKGRKVGRYGVTVGETPELPTTRLANFGILSEAMRDGTLPKMPDILVEAGDFPQKDKILQRIEEVQQQARQLAQQQAQANIPAPQQQRQRRRPAQAGAA